MDPYINDILLGKETLQYDGKKTLCIGDIVYMKPRYITKKDEKSWAKNGTILGFEYDYAMSKFTACSRYRVLVRFENDTKVESFLPLVFKIRTPNMDIRNGAMHEDYIQMYKNRRSY